MHNYVVDISKPPIPPPLRIIEEGVDPRPLNDKLTKEYHKYLKEYCKQLKEKQLNEIHN